MAEPDGCCVPETDMLVIRDMNMAAPYKGGNQYARICPECGSRTFTTKQYWKAVEDPYIIPNGDNTPVRLYDCPYDECDGTIYEGEAECDDCEKEIVWQEDDNEADEQAGDQTQTEETAV